jgi:hypothetical protein
MLASAVTFLGLVCPLWHAHTLSQNLKVLDHAKELMLNAQISMRQ